MWALRVSFVVGAIQVVLAAPGIPPRPQLLERLNQNGSAPTAPCGTVSASAAAALATAPNVRPIIDAQLAVDCLNSVPLRAKEAVELVDAIRPYMEWQSDSAYLKSPPADYPFPAVDLFRTLDAVKANITTGKYQNEVQFQTALFNTFTQAHDGHFVFFPDALTKGFAFRRQVALVSISSDGIEIPKIYVYNDTVAASQAGSTFKASAVTKINEVEASRFLQDLVNPSTPFQDQDAGYPLVP